MTERARNITVGITLALGLAGVALMLLLFGYGGRILKPGYDLRIFMDSANGLGESSRVLMAGIDVGGVRMVELADPPTDGVRILVRIDGEVRIPRAIGVSTEAPLLLGGSSKLVFSLRSLDEAAMADLLPTDGSALLDVRGRPQTESLAAQMRSALAEPLGELRRVADNFETLAEQWRQVGANLNRLLEPRDIAAVDAGQAVGNVSSLIERADAGLREAQAVLEGFRRWTDDDELRNQTRKTLAAIEDSAAQLTTRFVTLSDELSLMLRHAQTAIEQAHAGEGTIGRLLHDPALYHNLNDAAERLKALLIESRLLIDKWKAEGVPIQF